MKKVACSLLTLVFAVATAHADAGDGGGDKSESLATTLSIAGSVVGPALIIGASSCCDGPSATTPYYRAFMPMMGAGVAAMVFGPSLGDWYAGKLWTHGLELRLAGGTALALGAATFVGSALGSNDGGALVGGSLALAGGAAIIVGTAYDVWGAHDAAREHNRSHHRIAVVPASRGLAVVGTF
jgi:hypothetical protein